jgi:hypothetical protein
MLHVRTAASARNNALRMTICGAHMSLILDITALDDTVTGTVKYQLTYIHTYIHV